MSSLISFKCCINTTDPSAPLGVEIWLDDDKFFDQNHVTGPIIVNHEIDTVDQKHILKFILKNKIQEHTTLDVEGNIVHDACITVSDVSFDDINLGQVFVNLATYKHDFNGTQNSTAEQFFGTMGCNGCVELEFSTPIYLWLLEHM